MSKKPETGAYKMSGVALADKFLEVRTVEETRQCIAEFGSLTEEEQREFLIRLALALVQINESIDSMLVQVGRRITSVLECYQ